MITRCQSDVLHAIERYFDKRGFMPSMQDLADALGYKSLATVHKHLAHLEAKGYIVRNRFKPRSIVIVPRRNGQPWKHCDSGHAPVLYQMEQCPACEKT